MSSVTERLAAVARPVEDRVANALVERVLTSRLHPLLSWHLVLLSYAGRRSGVQYTTPVMYWDYGDRLVATTPAGETNWWRNFRKPYDCRLCLRGSWYAVTGVVVDDTDAVRDHADHAARNLRRLTLGRWPSADTLDAVAADLVLVEFTPEDRERTIT